MENIDEYDLLLGGTQFNNANELWAAEGIQPSSSAKETALKLEKERSARLKKLAETSQAQPIIKESTSIQAASMQAEASPYIQTSSQRVTSSMQTSPQRSTTAVQTSPYMQPQPQTQQPEKKEVTYVINREYNPIVYHRLYDWGLNYIPPYYSYEQRKRLEYLLESLIKKELLSNRPEYELERIIKQVIDNIDKQTVKPILNPVLRTVEKQVVRSTIKPTKKPSKKASKKPIKKVSKKSSKKAKKSKKQSKKSSKKTSKKGVKK